MSSPAIWRVPLLVLAGVTALVGLGMGVLAEKIDEPWAPALPWGFAGASLTFIALRIGQTGRVTRRDLELVVLAAGIFVAPYFLIAAVTLAAIALGMLIIEEVKRGFDRVLGTETARSEPVRMAPPRDLDDPDADD